MLIPRFEATRLMSALAVILPNWVGDVAMATPTLRALRARYGPATTLLAVGAPHMAEVLAGAPWIDAFVPWRREASAGAASFGGVPRVLREHGVDAAVLLSNSLRAAWWAWRCGARTRVGYARNCRGWLLTHAPRAPRRWGRWLPISAVDYYLECAAALGADVSNRRLELFSTPAETALADAVWRRRGWRPEDRVVALSTGGAYGAAKHWSVEQAAALARMLADEASRAVLVLCGPAEREQAAAIARLADNPRVTSLADETPSLGLTKACLRRCDLLVSTDSGPRHLAAGFGVPTVNLFGPTDPRWSENHHPRAITLRLGLPCQPCGKRVCPLRHHACMRELSAASVFAACLRLLDSRGDAMTPSEGERGSGEERRCA